MDFIVHAIQTLFLFLDQMVYGIARLIYGLLIDIANGTVFSQETIQNFGERVYALLGIFMLFKVTFSMINYIVNPEDFSDKQKGASKIIVNILTTLVLIVLTPRIFQEALDLQRVIIKEDILGRVILGETGKSGDADSVGDSLAMRLFGTFYYFDSDRDDGPRLEQSIDNNKYVYENYDAAFDGGSAYEQLWQDNSTYWALISTAAGVILFLVLIQFCFDIAIRTVKLGFLQLIAPIPIISRIDPKTSKDGPFGKWVKQCTKTYLDLFVRLMALYFAIYAINVFNLAEISSGGNVFAGAMIILGILLFAKQLPKFLEDLFGIKLGDGKFTLNPAKRLGEVPLVGGLSTAAGAKVGGLASSGMGFLKNNTIDRFGKKYGISEKSRAKHKLAFDNRKENFGLRNKAATVEALSRIKSSGVMGGEYKGPKTNDLYAAAATGDSSRKGGVTGILDNITTKAYRNLQHGTVEPIDSDGVKVAKGIKATISNTQNYMTQQQSNINMDLEQAMNIIATTKPGTPDNDKAIADAMSIRDRLRTELNTNPALNYKNIAKELAREYNNTHPDKVDADNLADLKLDFSKWVAQQAQLAADDALNGTHTSTFTSSEKSGNGLTFAEFNQALTQISKASDDHLTKERKNQEGSMK